MNVRGITPDRWHQPPGNPGWPIFAIPSRGWLIYYKLSSTYSAVLELSVWVRRRVRLYYWKQWKQPRTRRRHLLALGINPNKVHMATRSRKGYWRMSQNELVRIALNNRWLEEQGVPDMKAVWTVPHYGPKARV